MKTCHLLGFNAEVMHKECTSCPACVDISKSKFAVLADVVWHNRHAQCAKLKAQEDIAKT